MSGGYDFSQTYHAQALAFSPGTTFLATAYQNRLIVRSTATLAIVRTYQCLVPAAPSSKPGSSTSVDLTMDSIQWSPDSMFVLAFSGKAGMAWVFALTEEGSGEGGEVARIGSDVDGLIHVEWGKGGREVLSWSDYGLRLTIYDLSTGGARIVQHPKSHMACHTHSPDGRYLAVVERHAGKDHVGIYDTQIGYGLLRHFPLQTTDIQVLEWSPCGRYLAAVDSSLNYACYVHSPLGPLFTHFSPASPTFSPTMSSEDPGLGIRSVAWAPGGRCLALGGWDGKVRIVESDGWRCIAVLQWSLRTTEKDVAVWREPNDWIRDTRGRGIIQFDRVDAPGNLPTNRTDWTQYPPRSGISHLAFSSCAMLLLVRLETQPNVVHIHSFLPTPAAAGPEVTHVASIQFVHPIRSATWRPEGRKACITTRTGGVYFWDGEQSWVEEGREDESSRGGMMEGVGVPNRVDFTVHEAVFSPDGASLAVMDKDRFCILYDAPRGAAEPDAETSLMEGLSHIVEEAEWEESFRSEMEQAGLIAASA